MCCAIMSALNWLLVGHATTRITGTVYRKELRPVLRRGAAAMDSLFPRDTPPVGKQEGAEPVTRPTNSGSEVT